MTDIDRQALARIIKAIQTKVTAIECVLGLRDTGLSIDQQFMALEHRCSQVAADIANVEHSRRDDLDGFWEMSGALLRLERRMGRLERDIGNLQTTNEELLNGQRDNQEAAGGPRQANR